MKRYTDKKAIAYCDRVISDARRRVNARPEISRGWLDNLGRLYVVDGYRGYRLNKVPEGFPEDHIFETSVNPKIQKVHDGLKDMFNVPDRFPWDILGVPSPTAESVKAAKQTKKQLYHMANDEKFPWVNARYISEAMELLPDAKWYVTDGIKSKIKPVYAISKDGIAVILPVRVS